MNEVELLKEEINNKVKDLFLLMHKKEKSFNPDKDRINYAGRVYDENEVLNLVDSSLDFWLTSGKYSLEFSKKIEDFLSVKYCLLVNSGSSANLLAFMALTSPLLKERRIKRGDEVITVAAAFPTTVTPILQYGAIPVFVDINLDNTNIEIADLEDALSQKTKAIMIAHSLGNPFNIKEVKSFCTAHNLWLIEDNCDALGSKYDNKYTGTFGDISTSSFYPAHHITTGEGGAVYTNNQLLKKILLSLRDWGRDCWCKGGMDNTCGSRFTQQFGKLPYGYDHKYVYSHFGYNLKMTDLQASIGVAQMDKLPDFIQARKNNFLYLQKGLEDLENIFILPSATVNSEPSWFGFLIIIKDDSKINRNQITEKLENSNIQTRTLFGGNIIKHPAFDTLVNNVDYRVIGDLENTNKIMNDGFWIGVYPGLTKEMLDFIIHKIHAIVKDAKC